MSLRMVVVGRNDRFQDWLKTLPPEEQRRVRRVDAWSMMLGFRNATVEFMPDWRDGRSQEEADRILSEARYIEAAAKAVADPFAGNRKGGQ